MHQRRVGLPLACLIFQGEITIVFVNAECSTVVQLFELPQVVWHGQHIGAKEEVVNGESP